jgi:pSer/pThr/pTyr-binding forkhead associated (FHA) protein
LHDLGSKNGTTVNGVLVTRCQLRPGDHLSLGEHRLVVD